MRKVILISLIAITLISCMQTGQKDKGKLVEKYDVA